MFWWLVHAAGGGLISSALLTKHLDISHLDLLALTAAVAVITSKVMVIAGMKFSRVLPCIWGTRFG
jgi:hypothetical protein